MEVAVSIVNLPSNNGCSGITATIILTSIIIIMTIIFLFIRSGIHAAVHCCRE